MALPNKVRSLRQARRYSMRELARRSSISLSMLQYIEAGGGCSDEIKLRLCLALDAPLTRVFFAGAGALDAPAPDTHRG
jgi:transcriptional regulator with XRE-family HTH domain